MKQNRKLVLVALALATLAAPLLSGCSKNETSDPATRNETPEIKAQRADKEGK